jgi:hypothetical protein
VKAAKATLLESLAKKMEEALGSTKIAPGIRYTLATAQMTSSSKPVDVVQGKTVAFPFGPPYRPSVTGALIPQNGLSQLSLGMSLIGSAGETCSNMLVNGGRPTTPEFTITDKKGKVVQQGNFEYG